MPEKDSLNEMILYDTKKESYPDAHLLTDVEKIEDEYKFIFEEKRIRGNLKKNTNIPKFLVRIFLKYFKNYQKKYKEKEGYI